MKAHIGVRGHGTGAQPGDDGGQRGGYTQVPRAPVGPRRACGATRYAGVARRPEHQGRRVDWRWPCDRGSGGAWRPAAPPQASNARPRFERRLSIHFLCEAPLRLRPGAVSRVGQEPNPALPAARVCQSAAGGARRARLSGRLVPRAGAHAACPAAGRRPQPQNAATPPPSCLAAALALWCPGCSELS